MNNFDDDTMRPEMEALKEMAKQRHDERVLKTAGRIEYAIQELERHRITYIVKNKSIGHFHCFDNQGNLFQFWAGTGKIFYDYKIEQKRNLKHSCREWRGINNLIKLLIIKEKPAICELKCIRCKYSKDITNSYCYCRKKLNRVQMSNQIECNKFVKAVEDEQGRTSL